MPLRLVKYVLYLACMTQWISCPVAAHPLSSVRDTSLTRRRHGPPALAQHSFPLDSTTYLSKFGYLPKSDMETGALRNKTELTNAVRKFQQMAHLPVTGELDDRTVNMMEKPRCGMSDDVQVYFSDESTRSRVRRYVLGPSTWPNRDLTYRILNYTPDLPQRQIEDALYRAFKLWSDSTQLTFRKVDYGDADILIRFASWYHQDGYRFDGPGMTLAHAFFPGPDIGGDVHFDEDETWTSGTQEGVNLYTVAAHEIGHALGLAHSSVLGALMYPWYQGFTPDLELHPDDLIAIQYLYGVGNPSSPERPTRPTIPDYSTTPRPRPTAFTTRLPPSPTTPVWGQDYPPDACSTNLDAAALIRSEAFLFKGSWFWRIDKSGVMADYPVEIDRFFYGFPDSVKSIDAVYERVEDGKIVFFSGNRYWLFNGNHMDAGFPSAGKPITDMGFPEDIARVDAAFVWGYNSKTYLVTGSMYWRYSEELGRMDRDYPRDMSMWEGVPVPVDAAFQLWDGNTYFFQGTHFWKFYDDLMRTRDDSPEPLGPFWLECSRDMIENPEKEIGNSANSIFSSSPFVTSLLCNVAVLFMSSLHLHLS